MRGLHVLRRDDFSEEALPGQADGWMTVIHDKKRKQYQIGTRIVGIMANTAMQKQAYTELTNEFPKAFEFQARIEGYDFVIWAILDESSTCDGPIELLQRLQGVLRRIEIEAVLLADSFAIH